MNAIELFEKESCPAKKIDIVGFGNLPLIRHLDHKPAASIEENSYEMGEEAARLIFQHIHSEDSGNQGSIKKYKYPVNWSSTKIEPMQLFYLLILIHFNGNFTVILP